jgi:hypothetical protein
MWTFQNNVNEISDASRSTKVLMKSLIRTGLCAARVAAIVKVAAGYTGNVAGFGWSNDVYLKLQDVLTGAPAIY